MVSSKLPRTLSLSGSGLGWIVGATFFVGLVCGSWGAGVKHEKDVVQRSEYDFQVGLVGQCQALISRLIFERQHQSYPLKSGHL